MLDGLALATLSARSAAALLLIAVAGPPGGLGEDGRPVEAPVEEGGLTGEEGRGEDCGDGGLVHVCSRAGAVDSTSPSPRSSRITLAPGAGNRLEIARQTAGVGGVGCCTIVTGCADRRDS